MALSLADLFALEQPIETELMLTVFDLTNFTKFSKTSTSTEVFMKMKALNELTARFVDQHGGLVIKYIGDAGLCLFPRDVASDAILAMKALKEEVDKWLAQNIPGSLLSVNCHVAMVTVGPAPGFKGQTQLDVMGAGVNSCFLMGKKGFMISPQAFRSLASDARKHFKKYTPPITYHLVSCEV